MARKNTTIEDLAGMVKKGFDETAKQRDLDELKRHTNSRFDRVEERLENIEKLMLKQHGFEIQELKKRMKRIEDLFAIK